ncbi:hypothetical protein ACLLMF_004882 [Escherichia coli]
MTSRSRQAAYSKKVTVNQDGIHNIWEVKTSIEGQINDCLNLLSI